MKRWNGITFADNPKVDAFIAEVIEVSKRHGFSISHEDTHGAFEIVKYDEEMTRWLGGASDQTQIVSKEEA